MKKIKTLKYSLILLLVAFASCDDFVEVDAIGPVAEDFFNTEEEYEAALIGAYDMLQSTFNSLMVLVPAADDFGAGGDRNSIDQAVLQNVNYLTHTENDQGQLRDVWRFMYGGLSRTNYLLANKDKLEFARKDEMLAEAHFLRAYYTFELVKFFGNIPLEVEERNGVLRMADSQISSEEQFTVERTSSIAEVYGLIQEDLKEAIPNLPVTQDLPYEVTKGAAQALLGKAYLYNGDFSDAATVLNQVITSNQYSLVTGDDFTNLFELVGENGPESVFEIQFTNVEGAGWDCIQCSEGNYFVQFNGPRKLDDPVFETGWGFMIPSQALYDAFDDDDMRRDLSIFDLRAVKALDDADTYDAVREDTGLYNRKWLPRKADKAGNQNTRELTHQTNYRAIRYADVLLMAAEAEVKSSGTNAENYLNEVRERAYGNTSHDYAASEGALLDAIFDERRKELSGEGHRFFDLVRTGRADAAFDAYNASKPVDFEVIDFKVNKHEVFPIPLVELELAIAEERWGQNQGY